MFMQAAQIHLAKCLKGNFLGRISMGRENPVQYGGRRISSLDADRLAQLVRRATNLFENWFYS